MTTTFKYVVLETAWKQFVKAFPAASKANLPATISSASKLRDVMENILDKNRKEKTDLFHSSVSDVNKEAGTIEINVQFDSGSYLPELLFGNRPVVECFEDGSCTIETKGDFDTYEYTQGFFDVHEKEIIKKAVKAGFSGENIGLDHVGGETIGNTVYSDIYWKLDKKKAPARKKSPAKKKTAAKQDIRVAFDKGSIIDDDSASELVAKTRFKPMTASDVKKIRHGTVIEHAAGGDWTVVEIGNRGNIGSNPKSPWVIFYARNGKTELSFSARVGTTNMRIARIKTKRT